MTETKSRLLEAEKTKEALFYETILSYKRQLDESDKWIASHFADIDAFQQTEKALEQNEEVFERTEQIEAVLQTVTEQVDQLQQQLSAIQQNDTKMDQKITEWKKQAKEETPRKNGSIKLNAKTKKQNL